MGLGFEFIQNLLGFSFFLFCFFVFLFFGHIGFLRFFVLLDLSQKTRSPKPNNDKRVPCDLCHQSFFFFNCFILLHSTIVVI